jgi:hypothetical protein
MYIFISMALKDVKLLLWIFRSKGFSFSMKENPWGCCERKSFHLQMFWTLLLENVF